MESSLTYVDQLRYGGTFSQKRKEWKQKGSSNTDLVFTPATIVLLYMYYNIYIKNIHEYTYLYLKQETIIPESIKKFISKL